MTYEDLYVLIPSHSLEDFPTDLGEDESAGLLNAFAVLWHPRLLAQADTTPSWHRSDEPPELLENRLVVIPRCAEEWLPGGWAGHAELEGASVISGVHEREEMIRRALEPLDDQPDVDAGLVADFLALGTCYLMIELLTIHMHHFSNLDEAELQRDALAAAKAAVSGDETAAKSHLTSCFETLLEARERFYPVDCYLIDLCLLIPRLANEQHAQLKSVLTSATPVNFLINAGDLKQIQADKPDLIQLMREAWDGGRIDFAGGELHERPTPLMPLESMLWDFDQGQRVYRELFDRMPKTWGRRMFGFTTMLPQVLNKHGFIAALHIALDDGLYPDAEQSKIRWEGCDGTVVDAMTRIPLAGDSASSYLRFPQRMGESMEEDHVATVIFARWPDVKAPWFEDFRRIHQYAPVLGRFVTFEDFFENTDDPGRLSSYKAGEYLSPFLIQSVAYQEPDPISRYRDHLLRRARLDDAAFVHSVAELLRGEAVDRSAFDELETAVESFGIERDAEEGAAPEDHVILSPNVDALDGLHRDAVQNLADVIMHGAGTQPGYLLLNSLAFSRRTVVDLPDLSAPPVIDGPVKGVQFDDRRKLVSVEIPPCGFAWVTGGGTTPSADDSSPLLAEDGILRNEFFEVWINDDTGGIGRIKAYGRTPNRLSQQLAFRFPQERTWTDDEGEEFRSYYSEMRCSRNEITSTGPLLGEIVTAGDIVDQTDGSKLAGFQQTFRLYRGLPYIDVEIELADVARTPDGDPWSNYFGCRWAYNDMTAAVTRSVQQGAHGYRGQRFESLHYIEVASGEERITVAMDGNAFHRKTGPRMIDTLLVVAGETNRRFRFRIAFDADYPLQPALDQLHPPIVVPTPNGPPQFAAGWFFHLNAKNVQLLRLMDVLPAPVDEGIESELDPDTTEAAQPGSGFAVRLLETEGRSRRVRLRCFRTPTSARQRDFQGRTINELTVEGDAVMVEMTAYEIADVEVVL